MDAIATLIYYRLLSLCNLNYGKVDFRAERRQRRRCPTSTGSSEVCRKQRKWMLARSHSPALPKALLSRYFEYATIRTAEQDHFRHTIPWLALEDYLAARLVKHQASWWCTPSLMAANGGSWTRFVVIERALSKEETVASFCSSLSSLGFTSVSAPGGVAMIEETTWPGLHTLTLSWTIGGAASVCVEM